MGIELQATPVTLEERERQVLAEVADYAAVYNPGAIGRLELAWR